MLMILLSFMYSFTTPAQAQASSPEFNTQFGKVTAECKVAPGTAQKHVWIFKQWHLPSGFDAHDRIKSKHYPQLRNQTAIYRQLDRWIEAGQLGTVVAEGCSGELTSDSPFKLNGWTMKELEAESRKPHYDDEIIGSVPMKLEARYRDKVKTLCGDDEALIRENLLAFSDARGVLGYMTRLDQYKNDPAKAKPYLDDVIKMNKLPKDTTPAGAVKRLHLELLKAVDRIEAAIMKRNEKVVSVVHAADARETAVVYGGMHAAGIMQLLEKNGVGCSVVEPDGYEDDEAKLLARLHELVKG